MVIKAFELNMGRYLYRDMSNSLFRQSDFSPVFVVSLLEKYKCKNIKLYVF